MSSASSIGHVSSTSCRKDWKFPWRLRNWLTKQLISPGTQTADEPRCSQGCKTLTVYPALVENISLYLRTMGRNVLGLTHVKTFLARSRGPKVAIRWLKAGLPVAALIYPKKSIFKSSVNARYSSVRLSIGILFFSVDDYLGFSHPLICSVCFTSF